MIIGIGSDITNISRFERSIKAYGVRLIDRALGKEEKVELEKKEFISPQEYAASVAKRFAAKEACSKALGTGFRDGVFMKDIEIVHQPSGKPEMRLYNGAKKKLDEICQNRQAQVHVTMTDDYPWAQAFVVIEII